MRFSDAVVLGRTLADGPVSNQGWTVCLCGIAAKAMGHANNRKNDEAKLEWPWLDAIAPAEMSRELCIYDNEIPWSSLMTQLTARLMTGGMEFEEVVAVIRKYEPFEPDPKPEPEPVPPTPEPVPQPKAKKKGVKRGRPAVSTKRSRLHATTDPVPELESV